MNTIIGSFLITLACCLSVFVFATLQAGLGVGLLVGTLPFAGWLVMLGIYKIEGDERQ